MQTALILTRVETNEIQEHAQALFNERRQTGAASWANTLSSVRTEFTAEALRGFRSEKGIPAAMPVLLQPGENRYIKY